MSQYKEIANNINSQELEDYYKDHLPNETMKKFNIPTLYLFHQVLDYLGIQEHTPSENTRIQFDRMNELEKIERGNKISQSNKGKKEAIRIWTKYDPLKLKTAKEHNLNYITIY